MLLRVPSFEQKFLSKEYDKEQYATQRRTVSSYEP